jgi:autotransporter-associated beta strand protein
MHSSSHRAARRAAHISLRWAAIAVSISITLFVHRAAAQPRNLRWNPGGQGGTNWSHNPANLNWLDEGGNPTSFNPADIANFTSAGTSIVVIDGGGVTPGNTIFSNEAGNYTSVSGRIGGTGALVKTGAGSIRLDQSNSYTGGTVVNGGELLLGFDSALGAPSGGVTMGGGTIRTFFAVHSNRPVTLTSDTTSTISTPGSAGSFGTVSGGGSLLKAGQARLTLTHIRATGLQIDGGEVRMRPGATPVAPQGVSDLEALRIIGGPTTPFARLDLTNNAIIVGSFPAPGDSGASDEQRARQYIRAGHAGGEWTGNGIASSSADANQFAMGYAQAGMLGLTEFAGLPVQGTDVIIRFTRYGDSNIDGAVNLTDFNNLAANFGSADALWRQGDFNYDSTVNLTDFNLLAANFGLGAAGPDVTPEDWAALASAVPEPTGLIAFGGVAASAALSRRRRRR